MLKLTALGESYLFIHKSFQEYFLASYLLSLKPDKIHAETSITQLLTNEKSVFNFFIELYKIKAACNIVNPLKDENIEKCFSNIFLNLVGFGQQQLAEEMLKENKNLALTSSDLIDCAGRQFKNITGFQYAIWALDWNMWNMIERYMPIEAIQEQIRNLEQGEWVKAHGTVVSWRNLINALQTYTDHYFDWTATQAQQYWCQQVGGAQLILPAHVINEYCRRDHSFYPCPDFNEETTLPRVIDCYWKDIEPKKLGVDFAVAKVDKNYCIDTYSPMKFNSEEEFNDYYCKEILVYGGDFFQHLDAAVVDWNDSDVRAMRKLYGIRHGQRYQLILQHYTIERGIDVNKTNDANETPFFVAINTGNYVAVSNLLKAGADIKIENKDGETPLLIAVKHHHDEIAVKLISG